MPEVISDAASDPYYSPRNYIPPPDTFYSDPDFNPFKPYFFSQIRQVAEESDAYELTVTNFRNKVMSGIVDRWPSSYVELTVTDPANPGGHDLFRRRVESVTDVADGRTFSQRFTIPPEIERFEVTMESRNHLLSARLYGPAPEDDVRPAVDALLFHTWSDRLVELGPDSWAWRTGFLGWRNAQCNHFSNTPVDCPDTWQDIDGTTIGEHGSQCVYSYGIDGEVQVGHFCRALSEPGSESLQFCVDSTTSGTLAVLCNDL